MEDDRFDDGVRFVSSAASRRGVLAGLTSGLSAVLALGHGSPDVGAKRKKNKKKRRCEKNPCQGRPDDASCNGSGKCFEGTCFPRPTCTPGGASCEPSNQPLADCCGKACIGTGPPFPGICNKSPGGRSCYLTADCTAGHTCIGYRCVEDPP